MESFLHGLWTCMLNIPLLSNIKLNWHTHKLKPVIEKVNLVTVDFLTRETVKTQKHKNGCPKYYNNFLFAVHFLIAVTFSTDTSSHKL